MKLEFYPGETKVTAESTQPCPICPNSYRHGFCIKISMARNWNVPGEGTRDAGFTEYEQENPVEPQWEALYTLDMAVQQILFSFVANRDPYVEGSGEGDEEYGPLLSLLQVRQFSCIYLFCTGPNYLERARTVEEISGSFCEGSRFYFVSLDLDSPIDYVEIFTKLKETLVRITQDLAHHRAEFFVLLDPGTPQMQTAWFLLAKSKVFQARLLQGIPARFAGGAYKVREVNLDSEMLPEVSLSSRVPPVVHEKEEAAGPVRWYSLKQGDRIVGENAGFLQVLEQARRVAGYDISVLILGETGTGKGLLARFLHEQSSRSDRPFISVNCATIVPSLAESELFGHIKGAFTGADRDRLGKFRSAEGGTIFLDEIGDLPPEIQPKLLRVLEDKTLIPVGSDNEVKVDVRILTATNQDLERFIEAGTFRRDLYERLNQYTLALPPLRERKTDIPLLIQSSLSAWNEKYEEDKRISEEAMRFLLDYPWPGNIRELQNFITSMCATALGNPISPELLPVAVLSYFHKERTVPHVPVSLPAEGLNLKALLFQVEREFYDQALKRAGGNREKAARLLGINPPAFRKALRERFGGEGD